MKAFDEEKKKSRGDVFAEVHSPRSATTGNIDVSIRSFEISDEIN